jgi:hypothetical protein
VLQGTRAAIATGENSFLNAEQYRQGIDFKQQQIS